MAAPLARYSQKPCKKFSENKHIKEENLKTKMSTRAIKMMGGPGNLKQTKTCDSCTEIKTANKASSEVNISPHFISKLLYYVFIRNKRQLITPMMKQFQW